MRKWLPYAPNGMEGVWYFVNYMIPTISGSYATQGIFTQVVGAGPSTPGTTLAAWCALIQSGAAVGYIGTTTKLYTYDGASTFTDKSKVGGYTNTATDWGFVQYGNITLAFNGVDTTQSRDASGSAVFADLAAAPIAKIGVAQSNAVLLFNTSTNADGWAASDVGDQTNWTTGESASGRLIQTPGPITAAVTFGSSVLVFKKNAVYRMQYVGGSVKWTVELITNSRGAWGMHDVVVCGDRVVLSGPGGAWTFDGTTFVGITDYVGEVTGPTSVLGRDCFGSIYSPWSRNVFFCRNAGNGMVYNLVSDRWGRFDAATDGLSISGGTLPFRGNPDALNALLSSPGNTKETFNGLWFVNLSVNPCVIKNTLLWGSSTGTPAASLFGSIEGEGGRRITNFTGLDVDYTSSSFNLTSDITPSATAMQAYVFTAQSKDGYNLNSLNSGAVSVVGPVSSSTTQRRFDFNVSDVYARFNIRVPSGTGYVEVSDYAPIMSRGGML